MIGASARRVVATLALGFGLLAARPAAAQPDRAACQFFEIKASNEKDEIDAALKPLAKKFKRPPFSAWRRFALLRRHDRTAEKMKQVEVDLVPGGKLKLLLREKAPGRKVRLRLNFELEDKAGKRQLNSTVNLDAGDYTLIGNGEPLENDATYLVGVTCS